jgi:hypothetical protein
VANKTYRDLASKGDIIDTSFKLILMRVEVRLGNEGAGQLVALILRCGVFEDWKARREKAMLLRLEAGHITPYLAKVSVTMYARVSQLAAHVSRHARVE